MQAGMGGNCAYHNSLDEAAGESWRADCNENRAKIGTQAAAGASNTVYPSSRG